MTLRDDIASALNRSSAENGSNTPDFILAAFLEGCLRAFDAGVTAREDWYGHRHGPGQSIGSGVTVELPEPPRAE